MCVQLAEGERSLTLCNSCYNKIPVICETLHMHVHFYLYTKQQQSVCNKKIKQIRGGHCKVNHIMSHIFICERS